MSTQTSWAPPLALVTIGWLSAVGAAGFALLTDERPGQILLGVACVVLVVLSCHGSVARPRLSADTTGLTVRGMLRSRRWSWGEVNVRVARTRRLGREVRTLELDAEDDLVVLSWIDLGAHPEDVADSLRQLRI